MFDLDKSLDECSQPDLRFIVSQYCSSRRLKSSDYLQNMESMDFKEAHTERHIQTQRFVIINRREDKHFNRMDLMGCTTMSQDQIH